MLHEKDTVLLRRGEGELLVVQFEVYSNKETEPWNDDEAEQSNDDEPEASNEDDTEESNDDDTEESNDDKPMVNAELCVLRHGRGVWELMEAVPVVLDEMASSGKGAAKLMQEWETDAAIPIGDRFLCFVDYLRGMLLCDTADMESRPLTLRYVPLPVAPAGHFWSDEWPCMRRSRNLSAAGAGAVRFVSVDPRCCCGGPGSTTCKRGWFAFTVTTWTLSLPMDDGEPSATTWVKDGVLDCEELWAFPAYDGLPRVHLEHPIVSSDDPDVVCFTVCEDHYVNSSEEKVWMLEVNTRSKELLSAIPLHHRSMENRVQQRSGETPVVTCCY
ncbi:hypothetical protein BAE44_0016658 [Dichanthelium oligosanthes]|uniref:DUF1618 domain-containing protein n=1 Tax=Dichanthelium oligosanthes TaxID=888268 RepID=A0A1E5VAZ3_9POAL|nr:hypothetical protein BAE44_0016658 [Dichanthelium oligosanthes]